ncbi:hypothetical protein MASR1M8_06780 [Thermomonas brevis]
MTTPTPPPASPTLQRMHALLRRLCRIAGIAGFVLFAWALVDPSIMAGANAGGMFAGASPRWWAAFGLAFSAVVFAYGMHPREDRA